MDGQPPPKRQKIQLSEVPALLEKSEREPRHSSNTMKDISMTKMSDVLYSRQLSSEVALDDDFTQEERVEETQIQASLPLYLDHIFGTHIGQSQITSSVNTQPCGAFTQSPNSLTQSCCQHTALLDSQGFIKKSMYASYSRNIRRDRQRAEEVSVNDPLIVVGGCSTQPINPESQCFIPYTKTGTPLLANATSPDSKSDCGFNSSPVLFHSPSTQKQPESTKQVGLENSRLEQEKNQTATATANISDKISPKDHCQRKRKRDLSHVHLSDCDSPGYACPLMCTPLAKCSQVHVSVSVFAMILQGK